MTAYAAAPHMLQFRCIGTACEDTCCKAWDVPISTDDQARLAGAIGAAADDMVNRIPNGKGGTLVVLRKLPGGACTQLDDAQLCALHARLGEEVLPDVCATYPRVIGRVGDRLELTGQLSCPEVARLSLLRDEPPLVEAPPEPFGRLKVRFQVSPDGTVPYLAPFEAVRDVLSALCTAPNFSMASRLYFIAELAERLAPYYHRDVTTVDWERLSRELTEIRRPEVQAELHARRGASSPLDGLALHTVIGLIQSRSEAAPAFTRIIAKAARTHGDAAGVAGTAGPLRQLIEVGPERMWRIHMERRARLGPVQTQRLENYLARYCRNYWLQDWYPLSPSLLEHTLHLVLRVALLRFLLIAHPDLGPDGDVALTERTAVEVFYATSRAFDHNQSLREALSHLLAKQGMVTVGHAAALLKL